jgi:hypothetical protein
MGQELRAISETGAKRTGQHKGGIRQKYVLSEADRNLLRAVYGNPEYGSVEESINYLVKKFGVPRTTLKGWAHKLGLTHTRDDYWRPEDLAYLEEYYQKPAGKRASIKSIARHLGRSEAAVRIKAKRMKFRRFSSDSYTAAALADALGCDRHKVLRWIERGWLSASIDKSRENRQYMISPKEIRRFIISYPDEIDHRRVDWLWLLDILVGDTDRIGGPEQTGPKKSERRTLL